MSRVRLIAQHPDYGTLTNLKAILAIETSYNRNVVGMIGKLDSFNIPPELRGLSRWKRAVHLTVRMPGFTVRTFREPRRVRPTASLFWNALNAYGVYPKRKTKPKKMNQKNQDLGFGPIILDEQIPGQLNLDQVLQARQAMQQEVQRYHQRQQHFIQMNPLGAPWLQGWKPV